MSRTVILQSKFSYTLLMVYLLLAPFLIFAVGILVLLSKNIINGEPVKDFIGILLFPIFIFLFFGYTILYYIRNSKKVRITTEGIEIGRKTVLWGEVNGLSIIGKQPIRFIIARFMQEAVTITLKSGEEIYIWVDFYGNGSQIRQIMKQAETILKNNGNFGKLALTTTEPDTFTDRDVATETFTYYKRSAFRFFSVYIFIGFLIFSFFVFNGQDFGIKIAFIILLPIIFFIIGWQQHYFMVSDNFLVVKNHWLLWRKLIIPINDITGIRSETLRKQETALVVTTGDYKTQRFQAGRLKQSDFSALIDEVNKNIKHKKKERHS